METLTDTLSRKKKMTLLRILEAASHLFSEQGYHSVTMEMIATHAGLSRSTVYTFFKSKEVILDEILDCTKQCLERVIESGPHSPELFSKVLFEHLQTLSLQLGFIPQIHFHPLSAQIEHLLEEILGLNQDLPFNKFRQRGYPELNKQIASKLFWPLYQQCSVETAGSFYFSQYIRGLFYQKIKSGI